jgi:hypothetical protein
MDARNPLGIVAILILAAAAVYVAPGWPTFVGALTDAPPTVTTVATPGTTTFTVTAATRALGTPADWTDYATYARTGRWPTATVEAAVQLDDRRLGATPILERPLQPGPHALVVTRNGYLDEALAFEAQPDAAHRADVLLFPDGEHEARARHLAETAFYARARYLYLGVLYLVAAFHVISLLAGLGRRLGRRLALAILHVPLVGLLLLPATRLQIAFDLPPWIAIGVAVALLALAPLALHPRPPRKASRN